MLGKTVVTSVAVLKTVPVKTIERISLKCVLYPIEMRIGFRWTKYVNLKESEKKVVFSSPKSCFIPTFTYCSELDQFETYI
uniref:Reverse transcriptase n=1 Tax=Syphacia muris TaxID=451379 RepID=A0A0N5AEM1_9BILA